MATRRPVDKATTPVVTSPRPTPPPRYCLGCGAWGGEAAAQRDFPGPGAIRTRICPPCARRGWRLYDAAAAAGCADTLAAIRL